MPGLVVQGRAAMIQYIQKIGQGAVLLPQTLYHQLTDVIRQYSIAAKQAETVDQQLPLFLWRLAVVQFHRFGNLHLIHVGAAKREAGLGPKTHTFTVGGRTFGHRHPRKLTAFTRIDACGHFQQPDRLKKFEAIGLFL